jgi:hypothetical protein
VTRCTRRPDFGEFAPPPVMDTIDAHLLPAKVSDRNGKLLAHGTTTCLIFPLPA